MFNNKWNWSSIFVLLLISSMLMVSIFFDKTFVEKWVVPDGEMDATNTFYLIALRVISFCFSVFIFILWLARDKLTDEFAHLRKHIKYGNDSSISELFPNTHNKFLNSFCYIFLFFWSIFLAFSLFADPSVASSLVWEAGLFETLTVMFYVISAVFLIKLLFSNKDKKSFFTIYLVCFFAFCIFIAGEEISWGQTYFHFETPELLKEANVQGESGLHNIQLPGVGSYFINDLARMLAFFCGLLIPCILLLNSHSRKLFVYLGIVPPPFLAIFIFILAFAIPGDSFIPVEYDSEGLLIVIASLESELREITMSVAFLIWTYSIGFSNYILKK
jgi:hypothetical protein